MNTFIIQIVYNHDNSIIKEVVKTCSCSEAVTYANTLCKKFINCSWRIAEMIETIEFETYPPMFVDYQNYIENEKYDEEIRVFSIPLKWAINWISSQFDMELDEFMKSYTWDDTFNMYESATEDGVICSNSIESR